MNVLRENGADMGRIVSGLVLRGCWFAFLAATITMIDVSLANAELNPVLETGVKEMKRIEEENWWNTQFTALLAGIAILVFYFLVKSPWLLPSKDRGLKDASSQEHAAVKPSSSVDFRDPAGRSAIGKEEHAESEDIEEEFAKVSEADYSPAEDDEGETEKIVFKGAKWGFVVGGVIAMVYIQMHTLPSLGFYPGDAGLVFFACMGPATAVGALFAWLSTLFPGGE